jgi:4-diphosphocytidyl-2-C-methyl-D-erythritol kinase
LSPQTSWLGEGKPRLGPEFAPAKVNLFLHVIGRRPDGYHLLDSLAVFAAVGDRLWAAPGEALSLDLRGPFAGSLSGEPDNLVLRAARALAEAAGVQPNVRLTLEKNLPVASGLGGGSADAAAALRLLSRAWGVDLARAASLAEKLGADAPVCLRSRPARMGGVGEALSPAPRLPEFGLALVNPGVPVSTPDIFRARTGPFSEPAQLPSGWPDAGAMAASLAALRNDLQPPATALCPAIAGVLATLEAQSGCLLARLSGSGATCFAIFADAEPARRAAQAAARPGWWSWGGSPFTAAC